MTGLVRYSEMACSKLHFTVYGSEVRKGNNLVLILLSAGSRDTSLGVCNLVLDWFQSFPAFFMPLHILHMIIYLLFIGVNVPGCDLPGGHECSVMSSPFMTQQCVMTQGKMHEEDTLLRMQVRES